MRILIKMILFNKYIEGCVVVSMDLSYLRQIGENVMHDKTNKCARVMPTIFTWVVNRVFE